MTDRTKNHRNIADVFEAIESLAREGRYAAEAGNPIGEIAVKIEILITEACIMVELAGVAEDLCQNQP